MLYLIAKLLLGNGDVVRMNLCRVPAGAGTPGRGLGLAILLLGLLPFATHGEQNLDSSPND